MTSSSSLSLYVLSAVSAVGMSGTADGDLSGILDHPALLALYLDRIIAARDHERAQDPRLRLPLAAALGDYPAAFPILTSSLTLLESIP